MIVVRRHVLAVLLPIALAACGTAGPASPIPSPTPSAPAPATASTTVEASASPTVTASTPLASALQPDPTLTPPPDATLQVDGGDPVIGELGSWTWMNAGSDAPYLPGFPIHVGAGERLVFTMTVPVPIESWYVQRVPPSSIPNSTGVVGMGEGIGDTIWFEAPPDGTWALSVSVLFANSRGGAAYYWQVTVD